jgi:hypothetical protein
LKLLISFQDTHFVFTLPVDAFRVWRCGMFVSLLKGSLFMYVIVLMVMVMMMVMVIISLILVNCNICWGKLLVFLS